MNTTLSFKLFGIPEIYLGEIELSTQGALKARALLYYLVATRQTHSRAELADFFWPNSSPKRARQYLRNMLVELRLHVGPWLHATPDALAFRADEMCTVDLYEFTALLSELFDDELPAAEQNLSPPSPQWIETLHAALTLFDGGLLRGIQLPKTETYNRWVVAESERLHSQLVLLLWRLIKDRLAKGNGPQALNDLDQLLKLEPWNEEAHYQTMLLLAQVGERRAALHQYELCVQALSQELDMMPSQATTALAERIRTGIEVGQVRDELDHHDGNPNDASRYGTLISTEGANSLRPKSAPAPTRQERGHRPPTPIMPLLGRDELVEACVRQLYNPSCRLLTLLGLSGVGKSHLALAVANEPRLAFDHGIIWVDLRAQISLQANDFPRTQEAIRNVTATAITDALRLPLVDGINVWERLIAYLQPRYVLLVLDNLEHFMPAASVLGELLQQLPELKIMVTSREWVHTVYETTIQVPSLPFSPDAKQGGALRRELREEIEIDGEDGPADSDISSLLSTSPSTEPYASVELFYVQMARRAVSVPTAPAELAQIDRICRLVGGLPLAILIAADLTAHLPCEEIAEQIENDLALLTSTNRHIPKHHQSILGLISHMFAPLLPKQQAQLAAFAVFVGSFSGQAAESIVGATRVELQLFVDISLLLLTPTGRYALHPLVKLYIEQAFDKNLAKEAREHADGGAALANEPHSQWVADFVQTSELPWERYTFYYLDLVASNGALLDSLDAPHALALIGDDWVDIEQAWRLGMAQLSSDAIEDSGADSLTEVAETSYSQIEYGREDRLGASGIGLNLMADALWGLVAYCRRRGFYTLAQSLCTQMESLVTQSSSIAEPSSTTAPADKQAMLIKVTKHWALIHYDLAEYDKATPRIKQILDYARAEGLVDVEVCSLNALALCYANMGKGIEAEGVLSEVLGLLREDEDAQAVAVYNQHRATLASRKQQLPQAETFAQKAAKAYHNSKDLRYEAQALTQLGNLFANTEWSGRAFEYLERAREINRILKWPLGEAMTVTSLGMIHLTQVEPTKAIQSFEEAIGLIQQTGATYQLRHAYLYLSWTYIVLGAYAQAKPYLDQAQRWFQKIGDSNNSVRALTYQGVLASRWYDNRQALTFTEQAVAENNAEVSPQMHNFALATHGMIYLKLGRLPEAEHLLTEAIAHAQDHDLPLPIPHTLAAQIEIDLARDEMEKARRKVDDLQLLIRQSPKLIFEAEPFYSRWVCYQALHRLGDPQAVYHLEKTYTELQEVASRIHDEKLRSSFLEGSYINWQIVTTHKSTVKGS